MCNWEILLTRQHRTFKEQVLGLSDALLAVVFMNLSETYSDELSRSKEHPMNEIHISMR